MSSSWMSRSWSPSLRNRGACGTNPRGLENCASDTCYPVGFSDRSICPGRDCCRRPPQQRFEIQATRWKRTWPNGSTSIPSLNSGKKMSSEGGQRSSASPFCRRRPDRGNLCAGYTRSGVWRAQNLLRRPSNHDGKAKRSRLSRRVNRVSPFAEGFGPLDQTGWSCRIRGLPQWLIFIRLPPTFPGFEESKN